MINQIALIFRDQYSRLEDLRRRTPGIYLGSGTVLSALRVLSCYCHFTGKTTEH